MGEDEPTKIDLVQEASGDGIDLGHQYPEYKAHVQAEPLSEGHMEAATSSAPPPPPPPATPGAENIGRPTPPPAKSDE